MRRALLLVLPVAALGIVGAIVAVASHTSDAAFLYRQEHPVEIEPSQLEALLKKAGDPDPATRGAPAEAARCRPGSHGHQRNPWRCEVRYSSGRRIDYRIEVRRDGSYEGSDPTGVYGTKGCCLAGASPAQ